jgi:uncharacterized protein (TIGR02466 family)
MAKVNIFSSNVLVSKIESNQLKKEILKEINYAEKNNQNRIVSNMGGFQTNDLQNKTITSYLRQESIKLLIENYRFKKGKVHFSLPSFWINKNYKGNFNSPHVHPYSNFSGVYFVDVTNSGGGLKFLNNDTSAEMIGNHTYIDDSSFHSFYTIYPKNNLLVLFSSNLKHMVEPHFEDKGRITVAFNINIKHG